MGEDSNEPVSPLTNPLNPSESLKRPLSVDEDAPNPPQAPFPEDTALTKAEKVERHGFTEYDSQPAKRLKTDSDDAPAQSVPVADAVAERKRGSAPIKAEFLIQAPGIRLAPTANLDNGTDKRRDDRDREDRDDRSQKKKKGTHSGQNKARSFGSSRDALQLCMSRACANEFSPSPCPYGDGCKYVHDLRRYLREGKREDLKTFNSSCPIFEARGGCPVGWRCRFACAHSEERTLEDGRKELILLGRQFDSGTTVGNDDGTIGASGVVNVVSAQDKIKIKKKQVLTPKADMYNEYLNQIVDPDGTKGAKEKAEGNGVVDDLKELDGKKVTESKLENRARYIEPPFLASEKRRIFYGPETPVLAPLTTQGNLPFRRLCVELGAQVTWSEMAMGLPLIQGEKNEWALMKAHESELLPPKYTPSKSVVQGYDNSKDIRFGAQIASNKPWLALKTTEILTNYCPNLRAIDLNCGCPIDLVYRQGAGSALLDSPGRLEKILRGMNAVSGEVPITVKIRMGTKDNKPTADKLINRLAFGGPEALEQGQGPCGIAAITLHGRSRQQRYSRAADWGYISQCAALINNYTRDEAALSDTINETDSRHKAPSNNIYFIGNGDCYSHVDYYNHISEAKVDSVMVARGALIKPWIFEEISSQQYLDKSSTERLAYIEKFAKYGLQAWGSDEIGVGITRRFLLEWLSFSCRYVPIGLLEVLPPNMQDRPPAYRGRDELETLLASDNYRDWIKISEMFLGPCHKDFHFEPKHRSNSYEIEAEG